MTTAIYLAGVGTAFGDWLDDRINEVGISQAELSRESGVSESQLTRYRTGKTIPDPPTLRKLAPHLDASFEAMMVLAGHSPGDEREAANIFITSTDDPQVHRLIRRAKSAGETISPDDLALIDNLFDFLEQRRKRR